MHGVDMGWRSDGTWRSWGARVPLGPWLGTAPLSPCFRFPSSLRMNSFTYILIHAQLPSSTLVSCGVMFGYQCFIFIHREFSNIAYYIYISICMHTHTYPDAAILPLPDSSFTRGMGSVPRRAGAPGDGGEGGTLLDHPEPGLFQRKALCSWLFFSFLLPLCLSCSSPWPQISAPKLLQAMLEKNCI